MEPNHHLISRQVFEFTCEQEEHAFQIQNKFNHVQQEKIVKVIDRVCNQLAVENLNFQIPLLEINLGKISFNELEIEIAAVFEKAFYEKLAEWKNNNSGTSSGFVSKQQSSFKIAQAFLLTGRLPWFAGKQGKNYMEEIFSEVFSIPTEELRVFILMNLANEKFIERLSLQLNKIYLDNTINLLGINKDLIFEIEKEIKIFFEAIILKIKNVLLKENPDDEILSLLEKNKGKFNDAEKAVSGLLNSDKGANSIQLHKIVIALAPELISKKNKDEFYPVAEILPALFTTDENEENIQLRKIAFEFMVRLISGKNKIETEEQLYEQLRKMIAEKFDIIPAILNLPILKEKPGHAQLLNLIEQETRNIQNNKIDLEWQSQDVDDMNDTLKFYISNAGLIIISNYFPLLFKELQLLENGNFTGRQSQVKAVFLLHYLCTGEETVPEYTLPLNKILCGLPMDEPLPSFVTLSEKEKNECNELLNEIINNWQKLGNSSVEALREAFLNREGILFLENNGWKLQVERKGYDLLLDSLPWSYGHVKLSWMENIITTEW
jgi:hypothetical protein